MSTKKKVNYQYRSKFEAKIADQLKKNKIKFTYETERVRFVMPESNHVYKPDFILPNGLFIETKGKWDSDSRKKMALVKEQHPKLDIRILFMRDQPIRKGSETFYSDVCKKLGYEYAFKEIPAEWLKK